MNATTTRATNTVINKAPAGYSLPAALTRLTDLCEANGWSWLAQWGEDIDGTPFVMAELSDGDTSVRLSWHNRDRAPGRLGMFSKLWRRVGETGPDGRIIRGGWNWTRCPSLKAIEAEITT